MGTRNTSSGGPRTSKGKAISRLNAKKHGALSEVIPEFEVEAYSSHLDLVRCHYRPVGYLEEVLTDRIANVLWRIGRIARFEQAVIKAHVDKALNRDGLGGLKEASEAVLEALESRGDHFAQEWAEEMTRHLQATVALASVPVELVEKVPRYEAHLDRALHRSMNQLHELQRARAEFVSQIPKGEK